MESAGDCERETGQHRRRLCPAPGPGGLRAGYRLTRLWPPIAAVAMVLPGWAVRNGSTQVDGRWAIGDSDGGVPAACDGACSADDALVRPPEGRGLRLSEWPHGDG